MSAELQNAVLNYRLQNIYNVATSTRHFLLKFAVPDSKKLLVVECGNKVHLTEFERPVEPVPSSFVTKLRKHLKSRRLSGIRQAGRDRILVLLFSDGEFYLVLEFFSAGNVLLLDKEQKILALQRVVKGLGPENNVYATKELYQAFQTLLFASPVCVSAYPENLSPRKEGEFTEAQVLQWLQAHKEKLSGDNKKVFSVHKLLFLNASYLSNDLILVALLNTNIDHSTSSLDLEKDGAVLTQAVTSLNQAALVYRDLVTASTASTITGYIVEKKNPLYDASDKDSLEYVYDAFHPFVPFKMAPDDKLMPVLGYNRTVDQFCSTIESIKHSLHIEQQKQHAEKRLEVAKNERARQIESLVTLQEINERKGEAILYHAETVEACSRYVTKMLKKQMDWTDIENIVKFDKEKKHPDAIVIKDLNLQKNSIKLTLVESLHVDEDAAANGSSSDSSSSESESDISLSDSDYDSNDSLIQKPVKQKAKTRKKKIVPTLNVDINLSQSAFANASLYFGQKKEASSKQAKVEKNSKMAIKNVEKRVERDLAKKLKSQVSALKNIRNKYWFEKFFWFVSNEGYLCLAGRDDAQTDMIHYRYFGDDGYFVSSDIEGALKVFILNPYPSEDISPTTLFQAGTFALLTSDAWNHKASSSAWWLKGEYVTKKEFDGSLLGPGRLKYKAEKHFMPPAQLVMGFGLYWLGDEATSKKHHDARIQRQEEHGLKVQVSRKKADLEGMDLSSLSLAKHPEMRESNIRPELKQEMKEQDMDGQEIKQEVEPNEEVSASPPESTPESQPLETMPIPLDLSLYPVKNAGVNKGNPKKQKAEQQRKLNDVRNKYNQQRNAEQRDRKAEERELKKYLEAEEDVFDESYLAMLDSLLPSPGKNDTINTAVPVFAPWGALAKFKYKVKVQPGSGKKAKSVTEAYNYFSKRKVDASKEDLDQDWPEEHAIIDSLAVNDAVGSITVSKLKMTLPALGASGTGNGKGQPKKGKR